MSGCDSPRNGWFSNTSAAKDVASRCGPYLAKTLAQRGYRTWGIGKFHTKPWGEDLGFERQLHCEENHRSVEAFARDDYVQWLQKNHPEFDHLEQVHGERTDMYYTPQTRAQPAAACAETWVTDRAIDELSDDDARPFFGFVSYVQPHPPIAPPVPYNRMFNPDDMADPVIGDSAINQADPYPVWMNYLIWAEDVSTPQARQIKARYYGEIAFLDTCIGRMLERLRARPDFDNTLIVFFSDHGDMLGDHGLWQKESYFEAACRIPFLVSWPAELTAGQNYHDLVSLTDLFALATSAAGDCEERDGHDLLRAFQHQSAPRQHLIGLHEEPNGDLFKAMVRQGDWKYIWIANGGQELLLNPSLDPTESRLRNVEHPDILNRLRVTLQEHLKTEGVRDALTADGDLFARPRQAPEPQRILQFERGVDNYSDRPLN
jgi:arylsulfatase